MRIGAHIGVSGGWAESLLYACDVGAECVQVFAKSPRRWRSRDLPAETVARFAEARRATGIAPVLTHTAYLINLGSADDELWERSVTALADELARARLLGAESVVTHVGTAASGSYDETTARIALGVTRAFEQVEAGGPWLLLENTAGAGRTFGSTPAELAGILARLDGDARKRTALCLDTCHAHAAGFPLDTVQGWDELMSAYERECGIGLLRAVHANDSRFPSGSHRDRHAWIGEGTIGEAGFKLLFERPELAAASVIVEMPGATPEKDVVNLARLKALRDGASNPAAAPPGR